MADNSTPWSLPTEDLEESAANSHHDLQKWQNARILVTGGTGFLGSWLVSSLLQANLQFALDLDLVLVTRNAAAVPLQPMSQVSFLETDIRTLSNVGHVDLVIHGAASSSAPFGIGDGAPEQMAATIIDGSRAVIECASKSQARVLFLSSGAVYGSQFGPVSEQAMTAPDPLDPRTIYGLAKRLAESLFVTATASGAIDATIARLFAFLGPRLPLDAHYAAGNFLRDVLGERTIEVGGDGRPRRSYLYVGDLPEWCWAIAARGAAATAYNVGSPEALSIAELASEIAQLGDTPVAVHINGDPGTGPAPWYVPSTTKAADELGLSPRNDLKTALAKFYRWHKEL